MIRFFVSFGADDIEAEYARAFAEISPVRLIPTAAWHSGACSPAWEQVQHLFATPMTTPTVNVVSGPLGATWPATGEPLFQALHSPAMPNIAIVTGGASVDCGHVATDIAALGAYGAVISINLSISEALEQVGIFAPMATPRDGRLSFAEAPGNRRCAESLFSELVRAASAQEQHVHSLR